MSRREKFAALLLFVNVCALWPVFSACSSTAKIATAAHDIRAAAGSSRDRFGRILNETEKPEPQIPKIADEASLGIDEQNAIIELVDDVYKGLTGVQDAVPWWGRLLSYALLALSLVGLAFLAWYLRIAEIVGGWAKKLFSWIAGPRA